MGLSRSKKINEHDKLQYVTVKRDLNRSPKIHHDIQRFFKPALPIFSYHNS